MNTPKILFLDIETAPNLAYVWGKYEQDVIAYEQEGYILSYVAKWQGGKVITRSLSDYKGYKPNIVYKDGQTIFNKPDDKALVEDLWKLLDEADIVVAHNGDRFDVKKSNARFIFHKLNPPAPYKTIDTKKIKQVAMFNSNKLDDLGEHLSEGKKIPTNFKLWKGCLTGDMEAWNKMVKYNKQDVLLLERIYLRFRPWMKTHPNVALFSKDAACPKCGSHELQRRGTTRNVTATYYRLCCKNCGAWGRDSVNLRETKPIRAI